MGTTKTIDGRQPKLIPWTFAAFGAWTVTNAIPTSSAPVEAANAEAVVDDGGALLELQTSSSGAYTADYQPFPDAEQVNDAAYFGADDPFAVLEFDVDTAAVYGDDSITWEYYNGAWVSLSILYDNTDSTAQDGKRPFQVDGRILFIPPADWTTVAVNSTTKYWIRARVSGANITTIPTFNSVNHSVVVALYAPRVPFDCEVALVEVSNPGTIHTNTDILFYVLQDAALANSGQLTWGASGGQSEFWVGGGEDFTNFNLDDGAEVNIIVAQEDGADDPEDVLVTLHLRPT